MKAIILAAGKNKGLEREVPISLIEVQGKKIIDWQLDALRDVGIAEENIIIVVGYEKEQVRKHLIGKNVILIDNDQFNETRSAYSLWLARDFCKGGFVYVNGDLLFESEILKKVLDSKY